MGKPCGEDRGVSRGDCDEFQGCVLTSRGAQIARAGHGQHWVEDWRVGILRKMKEKSLSQRNETRIMGWEKNEAQVKLQRAGEGTNRSQHLGS